MSCQFKAVLHSSSPFADIFPDGVPVISDLPQEVLLEREGDQRAYFVDWDCVITPQRESVLGALIRQAGLASSPEVRAEIVTQIVTRGLPLRQHQVREVVRIPIGEKVRL